MQAWPRFCCRKIVNHLQTSSNWQWEKSKVINFFNYLRIVRWVVNTSDLLLGLWWAISFFFSFPSSPWYFAARYQVYVHDCNMWHSFCSEVCSVAQFLRDLYQKLLVIFLWSPIGYKPKKKKEALTIAIFYCIWNVSYECIFKSEEYACDQVIIMVIMITLRCPLF